MKTRNLQIDTLRGVACVFLVAYHVVGTSPLSGLEIDSGLYRELNDMLAFIRMPLFTFLSGLVYAYRPYTGSAGRYIKGKCRRLIIPMLVVGTLLALLQSFIPGTNSSIDNWYLLHIVPVGHFWFVESIFLIFLLMIPLEAFGFFKTKERFLLVFIPASVLYVLNPSFHYFAIDRAFYLLPFFLFGMALQRFSIINILSVRLGAVIFLGVVTLLLISYFDIFSMPSKMSLFGLLIGLMSCLGLLSINFKSNFFAKIGFFSYSIYLYHIFFTAGTRIFLRKLGVYDIEVIFILSLIMGIWGSIVLEYLFNGTNFTRAFLLGKSKTVVPNLWLTRYVN